MPYTLRDGVNFGPPLSRPVTAQDVYYAFKRIGTESIVAQYGFYYNVIEGMAGLHGRRRSDEEGQRDLGHRGAGRQDDRLPPGRADR